MRPLKAVRDWSRRWIRRRQGPDDGPVRLHAGRIYILPTRLGVAFGIMLFAMLLGSLNYGNNLGLALTFVLTSLGVVAMHACHRNLAGLTITSGGTDPPFAGQPAGFVLLAVNPSNVPRIDIDATAETAVAPPAVVAAGGDARLTLAIPTRRRGRVRLARFEVATRYPFGLFRAWGVLHPRLECVVWPRPADRVPAPPLATGPEAGGEQRGEEDFAGLKDYHPGDPPRRIAWKAHARGGELLVKEFAGAASPARIFDLEDAPGGDLEARLAVLARWIVDAHAAGLTFGLRLPGVELPPEPGEAQRRRCLTALAGFGLPPEQEHD